MERPYKRPYKPPVEEEEKKPSVGKIVFITVTVMLLIAVVAFSVVLYVKKERQRVAVEQETRNEQLKAAASAEWVDGAALLMYETEISTEDETEAESVDPKEDVVENRAEGVGKVEEVTEEPKSAMSSSSVVERRVSPVSGSADSDKEKSTEDAESKSEEKKSDKTDSTRTAASSSSSTSSPAYEYIMDAKEVKEQREYVPTIPLICAPEVGCDPMLAQDITNAMLDIPVRNYVELGESGWQFILTLTPCKDRFNLTDDASTHVDYFTQVIYFDNTAKSYTFLLRDIGHAVCAMNNYPQMRNEFKDIFKEEGSSLGYDADDDDSSAGDFFAEVYEGLVENASTMKRLCPRASAFVSNYME